MSFGYGFGFGFTGSGSASGPAPWSPALLTPRLWFDPSDLTTLWQDAAATVPVTADGQSVARMNDKGSAGLHVTQATASFRPLYKTDGTLHWLLFDSVDDKMESAGTYVLSMNHFIAAALSKSGDASSDIFGVRFGGTSVHTFTNVGSAARASARLRIAAGAIPTPISGVNAVPAGTTVVLGSLAESGGNIDLIINGATPITAANGYTTETASNLLVTLGGDSSGKLQRFYGGQTLQRSPTTEERDNLRIWLAAKGGVTL